MLLTFDVDVLVFGEDNVFPSGNGEDPGISVIVHSENGLNYTVDVAGLSVGLESLVLDHDAPQCVTEEDNLIRLENKRHDRCPLLISRVRRGLTEED
jgi:hypothetical protein